MTCHCTNILYKIDTSKLSNYRGQNIIQRSVLEPLHKHYWITSVEQKYTWKDLKQQLSFNQSLYHYLRDVSDKNRQLLLFSPLLLLSITSTPNCMWSPEKTSRGALSSPPRLRRWLLMKVPLLLFVSFR